MTWFSPANVAARRERVLELWAMGIPRREIAERVDLTAQRVSQIIAEVERRAFR